MEAEENRIIAPSRVAQPPPSVVIDFECQDYVIHMGPGVLHGILIGNAGCCRFRLHDDARTLFSMPFPFAGSFPIEMGFIRNLMIDMHGHMPCHLQVSYRAQRPPK
jgi:hypothetical protein